MTRIWIKKTPLCLALTLFALPAMADNIFSGVINFGREILDETRKLAPGVQNDRRNETPADTREALQDGRDRPAIETPSNDQYNSGQYNNNPNANYQSGGNQGRSNIELAPPVNGQPTGSNLNYTYGESQRSKTSINQQNTQQNSQQQNNNAGYNGAGDNNTGYNQYQYGQSDNYQAPESSNQGWQEENHMQ